MNLLDYAWDIFDIAKKQDKDLGVGRDMFIANLNNAGQEGLPYYAGADKVDYVTLGKEWKAMSAEEQLAQKTLYNKLTRANRTLLTQCRGDEDRDAFDAILAAALQLEEQTQPEEEQPVTADGQ